MIRPVRDNVLVKRCSPKESPGGIVLPDGHDEMHAEVIACGPGRMNDRGIIEPPPCKPGDRVLLVLHKGQRLKSEEGLWIIRAHEILAIVED